MLIHNFTHRHTHTEYAIPPPPRALINKGQLAIIISIFNQSPVVLLCGLSFDNWLSLSLSLFPLSICCSHSSSSALCHAPPLFPSPTSLASEHLSLLHLLLSQPLPSYRVIPLSSSPPSPSIFLLLSLSLSDECLPSLILMFFLSLCSSTGLQTSR